MNVPMLPKDPIKIPDNAPIIPDAAPFSAEQRAWLNGFFGGLVSAAEESAAAAPAPASAAGAGSATNEFGDTDNGEAPWHDQTMPIDERMSLAEDRPVRRKMMAAMAQQDCGQCGYECESYANKIWTGEEERLNLCVPGGKETTRMLKSLYELKGKDGTPSSANGAGAPAKASAAPAGEPGRSRDNPVEATFLSRYRLNKVGSQKETWHIEFDLTEAGLDYVVGDSFGIFAKNDPALVSQIISALKAEPDYLIGDKTLRQVLTDDVSLAPATDELFQLYSYISGGDLRKKAKALSEGEDPDGDAETLDVLAAIEKFPDIHPHPEAFLETLEPLQPRLYSISSSIKSNPGRISLTVDAVRYKIGERERMGLASTYLASRISPDEKLKVYVQKAHGFALPENPETPIIMVGPGTGIAPFRAFLHDRMATKAPGQNWLFFGHQKSASDFFYEDELKAMRQSGVLTRLSLAWSRDGDEKFYVQDRMREVGSDLWNWLAEGAHFYVCGDAQRMAKDVERALVDIVSQYGARSTDEAVAFLAELKKAGRYQQDVY